MQIWLSLRYRWPSHLDLRPGGDATRRKRPETAEEVFTGPACVGGAIEIHYEGRFREGYSVHPPPVLRLLDSRHHPARLLASS